MKILSIDHSFKRTGYGLLDGYNLVTTGAFTVGEMNFDNVYKFMEEVEWLLDSNKPDVVVLEKPAHIRNIEILRMLTSLYTSAIIACQKRSIPFSTVNPKMVKKHITGNGSANKEQVMKSLIEKYNFEEYMLCEKTYYKNNKDKVKSVDYDESDAIANAIYYIDKVEGNK